MYCILWYTFFMPCESEKMSEKTSALVVLVSLCFYLSAIEYAIPKPMPFMRLGLANLPVILSLNFLGAGEYFALVLIKVLIQAVISGTLFSYVALLSFAGSFSSAIIMFVLYRIFYRSKAVSFLGISVAGAMCNNVAQLAVSRLILFGANTKYIAPLLLVSGLVFGFLTGFVSVLVSEKSVWYKNLCEGRILFTQNAQCGQVVEKFALNKLSTMCICFALILAVTCVFTNNTGIKWICVALLLTEGMIVHRGKIKLMTPLIITAFIILFEMITPRGKVLFSIFSWHITMGALLKGLNKTANLNAMLFASQTIVGAVWREKKGQNEKRYVSGPNDASEIICKPLSVSLLNSFFIYVEQVMNSFEKLTTTKISLKKGEILRAVDNKLCEVWGVK